MKMKIKIIFLAFLSYSITALSHEVNVHQYVVAQAFKLLEAKYAAEGGNIADLAEMKSMIFHPDGTAHSGRAVSPSENPWSTPYPLAVGAYDEDMIDPIWFYGLRDSYPTTFEKYNPLAWVSAGISANGFTPALTHFWAADDGADARYSMGDKKTYLMH